MPWYEALLDTFLDSLKDAAIVFAIAITFYIILSFFEDKISKILDKHTKIGPLLGASLGLIPQCGISVVSADMYVKKHITIGTLIALFLSCSDEALPILFSRLETIKFGLILLASKFVIGLVFGFLIDFIVGKRKKDEIYHHLHDCHHKVEVHTGCCGHEIDNEEENKWHKHLVHPLIHSLKLFAYVLVLSIIFGMFIYLIGEENFANFITTNKYLSPLYAAIIGIIPNCASSTIISELFVKGHIGFAALLSGLLMNAGLGLFYLIKNEHKKKNVLYILLTIFLISLFCGYITGLIIGF